ncbi:VOC family protein [Flavobacterium beibuense]|uniref:Glyoxalase family protein n=1 Tax=Flavobacterium beibuense TaxID=657326 RepID=A0A444W7N0_9FLAO|nr:VOC family protein [Flavobacterium beibuense]RYJ41793.1 Glyoxalase family protein [Flavobacterium beibuense]
MLNINRIHHIAIICSDYYKSKHFYTNILGFTIEAENYRQERQSYKLDLSLKGQYTIELFSFPNPPARVSRPEAAGLRHIAFETDDINTAVKWLNQNDIATEPVRIDEFTGKKFTFFSDPDNLPVELYEK